MAASSGRDFETSDAPSARTKVRRHPERGRYDRESINAILDEAPFCHVGFLWEGHPVVIPTIHARLGDQLYVHGSSAGRMMRGLVGVRVCVTVTLLDALVLARSAFNHSMNYRSVMVLGKARTVTDPDERLAALKAVVEHVVPGRWEEVRPPTPKELKATSLLAVPIDEASAKVRSGPPVDDPSDAELPIWAGELRLAATFSLPRDHALGAESLPVPRSVRKLLAGWANA